MSVPFILNDCCLIPRGKDWAVFSLRESSFIGPSGPTDYPVWADSKEAAKEWVGKSVPISETDYRSW